MAGITKDAMNALKNKNRNLLIMVIILAVLLISGMFSAIFVVTNSKVTDKDWTPYPNVSFSTDGKNWFPDLRSFNVNEEVYMKIVINTKVHKRIKGKPEWHDCVLTIPNSKDVVGKLVSATGSGKYERLKNIGISAYTLNFQVPNDDVEETAKTYLVKFVPIEVKLDNLISICFKNIYDPKTEPNWWTEIDFK